MRKKADICLEKSGFADTSAEAFRSTPERVRGAQRQRILDFIRKAGPRGATADEAEEALGLPHQSGSARTAELRQEGLIHFTAERRNTRQGKPARVYFEGAAPAPSAAAPARPADTGEGDVEYI